MTSSRTRRTVPALLPLLIVALAAITASFAFQVPREAHRFDALLIPDPSTAASPAIHSMAELEVDAGLTPGAAAIASGWKTFRLDAGEQWSVWLDARSGAPALVQGQGIPWIPGSGNGLSSAAATTIDSLATSLRGFMRDNAPLFAAADAEMVLDRAASGALTPDLWQIVFTRTVDGVPVTGDGYVFSIGHGNLISFGSPRWSTVTASPVPTIDAGAAFARLRTYLGLGKSEMVAMYETGTLAFTPMEAAGTEGETFTGTIGAGYRTALTWRFVFGTGDEAATWVGLVDAHTGAVLALYDDTKYAQVKGGVFPFSNDGTPPDGVEVANYPMPFASLTVNGGAGQSNASGNFACTGGSAVTTLTGPYVRVVDNCGAISQSVSCDNDLNLGVSGGTDCTVPAGSSAGNTHSSRSSFYHLNRIKEHARGWLPANAWLGAQLTDNVNINLTCNAFWSPGGGTVNFYRSGGGCRNTGEIAGVFLHEWGHGLSQNDGAASSNPDEGYADITSFLLTHNSCIGRGFTSSNCGGYGNACLSCTGVRDVDYNKRANHAPQTPANWPGSCSFGSGPCGREVHCEGYLPGETLWDLAVRDLTAAGIDQNTAWMLVDRMWYKSRTGTSGFAYSCGATVANRSCLASHWMQQLRVVDDDDGNLANGTPHAAAIFAAFNRHLIPCGAVGDAVNQSTTVCPALAAPVLTGIPSSNTANLSWGTIAGAASYNVLRNDQSCTYGHNLAANQAGTSYSDTGLANGVPEYYAVQAVGSNTSCLSPLSNCVAVTPVATSADVSVTVADSPDPVSPGQNLTYTINVGNAGPDGATGLSLSESVSTRATFVSLAAPGWVCSTPSVGASGAISCTLASLGSGGSSTLTLVVKIASCAGSSPLANSASISTSSGDPIAANNTGGTSTAVTDPGTCDDSNPCTQTDVCSGSTCVGGNPVVCSASDQCHNAGTCSVGTGLCSNPAKPNGSACSDGNACTTTDTCQAGACTAGAPVTCTPSDQCHNAGTCNTLTGLCSNPPKADGSACSDGNACTQMDSCQTGACLGTNPVTCTASDQCHDAGTCNTGTGLCSNPAKPNGSACSDGNACTQTDTCQTGACLGANPVTCTASDQCHDAGTCDTLTGACSDPAKADGSACSDGSVCTQTDTCQTGACVGASPVTCTASDQCHDAGTCDSLTGCSNPPKADGSACSDGDICTIGDACQTGACAPGAPAPPPTEVNDSVLLSGSAIAWTDGPGTFNVYRGTQTVGSAWSYDQTCLASSVSGPAGDPSAPAADGLFYYLVSRRDACGESVPGRDSLGTPIPNASPCP